jgi:hypothetical protein
MGVNGPRAAFGIGGQMAADSGASAVYASKARREMKEAQTVQSALPQSQNVRNIEGKTFTLKDGIWTDAEYDAMKSAKVESVKFASPEYFALLKDARVAKWLSVGERVLVVLNGRALKIEP